MVDIKEKFIEGKRPDQLKCEDGLFINENFVAVIDGVTSKGKQNWQNGMSSGCYAKEVIKKSLETMPREASMEQFFETVNTALYNAYISEVENDFAIEWLRACMVVYSDHHSQIWSVGDCQCMINGKLFCKESKVDDIMASLRSFIIHSELKKGRTEADIAKDDIGRDRILQFVRQQNIFENDFDSPFGYAVLNGHGFDKRSCVSYDVIRGDTVVLSSDGYPVLCSSLEESERKLSYLLENDPLCYKEYLCTKGIADGNSSFDDRSYVKFVIV